ncbi:MAG TPA: alpha-glucosidase [Chthoniobacterales bacterium]
MKTEWWRGAIIYQIYPRSFFDANADGIGDLAGITQKLDYVASLGVDAVWISPFFKSPMRDFGYDVSDYRAVDPIFGNNEDFYALIQAAHERGLKVVVDMVMAHTSDQHAWFQESRQSLTNPKADWYVWVDPKPDGTPPNNWHGAFGGSAWQWNSRRKQYYLHHFLASQPNLNWYNPEVVAAMFDDARFWLDAGVDGLRLDAITTLTHDPDLRDNPPRLSVERHSQPINWQEWAYSRDLPRTLELLAELRSLVDQYDDRYLLGEVGDVDLPVVSAKYTRSGRHLHSCYNFELLETPLRAAVLKDVVERTERVLETGWTTWSMSNHDRVRIVTRCAQSADLQGNNRALAKLMLGIVLTLRGGACVYQGEELGLTEADIAFEDLQDPWGIEYWPDFKGRDGCRTPMPWSAKQLHAGFSTGKPWLPVPGEHLPLAVDESEKDPHAVLHTFRKLIAWRKEHPALLVGDFAFVPSTDPVLAFERAWNNKRILCIFNVSNHEAAHSISTDWHPIEGHGFDATHVGDKLILPPFGAWFGAKSTVHQ